MKNMLSVSIFAIMLLFVFSCKPDSKPAATKTQTVAPPPASNDNTKRKYPALNQKANTHQQPVMLNQSKASQAKMKAMKKLRRDSISIKKNK